MRGASRMQTIAFSHHACFTVGIAQTACFPDKEYGQRKAATRALKPSVWEVVPPTSAIRSIRAGVCRAHFVRRLFHLKPPCVSTSSVNVKLRQRFYQKRAKTKTNKANKLQSTQTTNSTTPRARTTAHKHKRSAQCQQSAIANSMQGNNRPKCSRQLGTQTKYGQATAADANKIVFRLWRAEWVMLTKYNLLYP